MSEQAQGRLVEIVRDSGLIHFKFSSASSCNAVPLTSWLACPRMRFRPDD